MILLKSLHKLQRTSIQTFIKCGLSYPLNGFTKSVAYPSNIGLRCTKSSIRWQSCYMFLVTWNNCPCFPQSLVLITKHLPVRDSVVRKTFTMKDLRFSRRWLWRMPSSGMWRRVHLVWTGVSEKRIAYIFRVEKSAKEEPAWADYRLQPPAHAGPSLGDFFTLKMRAIRSSETSVHTRCTRRHIPVDGILQHLRYPSPAARVLRSQNPYMKRISAYSMNRWFILRKTKH
jgi:hypothetical protein